MGSAGPTSLVQCQGAGPSSWSCQVGLPDIVGSCQGEPTRQNRLRNSYGMGRCGARLALSAAACMLAPWLTYSDPACAVEPPFTCCPTSRSFTRRRASRSCGAGSCRPSCARRAAERRCSTAQRGSRGLGPRGRQDDQGGGVLSFAVERGARASSRPYPIARGGPRARSRRAAPRG